MLTSASFTVGGWKVEPDLDRVSRGSESASLRPQVMSLLVYLAERPRQVIHPDVLMRALWPGKIVCQSSLYNCVAELRSVLDAGNSGPSVIQTVPKKGYRLRASVAWSPAMPGMKRVYRNLGFAETTTRGCWRIVSRRGKRLA
jgi:transcriptional activator of cad operon